MPRHTHHRRASGPVARVGVVRHGIKDRFRRHNATRPDYGHELPQGHQRESEVAGQLVVDGVDAVTGKDANISRVSVVSRERGREGGTGGWRE